VTVRFRHLPANSSGKTEKVNFQVNRINGAGVKTVSQSNAGTLNKCDGARVVRGLADSASETKAAVIY
jgi:predicted thioesterase